MRRPLAIVAIVAVVLGLLAVPASATPINDFFSAPTTLTGTRATRTADTNVGATSEAGEPQHAGRPGGASVWYAWTPSTSGPVTITTAGSSFDTLLAVYIGTSVNSLAGVVSNDDDPNHTVLTSVVHFDAVGATTYRIAVDGYSGDQGVIKLRLVEGPPGTTRVSLSDLDAEANDNSETAAYDDGGTPSGSTALSTTGDKVAFASDATNLILPTSDSNACTDVFVRDPDLGTTQRVSISDTEVQANDCSSSASISGDGNVVAFDSWATNLTSPAPNGNHHVFVRNISGGTTTQVSKTGAGVQGNSDSSDPSISSDGNVVAFESWATNLTSPAANGNLHILLRNLTTGAITQATRTSGGTEGNNNSFDPAVSSDGRYVVYESRATNLGPTDLNGVRDVYVTDTQTGTITRVSEATGGTEGDGGSFDPAISSDGRYIAFDSDATNFVANDTNASTDVFVHDTTLGTTTRISVRTNGTQGKRGSYDPQISADGRFVAFTSDAQNLVSGDSNGVSDVFVHDNVLGTTTRVSVDSAGNEGGALSRDPSISGDHSQIAFTSDANNLVAGDTLGNTDVFERPISFQGDALVKRSTGKSYLGDGVYESTPITQKLPVLKVRRGTSATFNLQLQNDGSVDDDYTVLGCNKSKGFTVAYKSGTTAVTTGVVAGTYTTGSLASGDAKALDLVVTVLPTAKVNLLKTCSVTLRSRTDTTKVDAVAAQVRVSK